MRYFMAATIALVVGAWHVPALAIGNYDREADRRFVFEDEIPAVEHWTAVGKHSDGFYTFVYYEDSFASSDACCRFGLIVTVNGVPDTELGVILKAWHLKKNGKTYGTENARFAHRITDIRWLLAETGQTVEPMRPPVYGSGENGEIAHVVIDRAVLYERNAVLAPPTKDYPLRLREAKIFVRFEYFAAEVSEIHFRISDKYGMFLEETVLHFEKAGMKEPRVRTKNRIR